VTNIEFAAGLRELADLYEQHPEMAHPGSIDLFLYCSREQFADTVKAMGSECRVDSGDNYFFKVARNFGAVSVILYTPRANVCRKVRRLKEVDDWECVDSSLESLMSGEGAAAASEVSQG
jgi:hypothetical protein